MSNAKRSREQDTEDKGDSTRERIAELHAVTRNELAMNDPKRYVALAREMLTLALDLGDTVWTAWAHSKIGHYHYMMAELDAAERAVAEGIALLSGREEERKVGAALYQGMSLIQRSRGEYLTALESMGRALEHGGPLGGETSAILLLDLGSIYYKLGDYARAIELMFDSITVFEQTGFETGICSALHCIGQVYTALNDQPRAEEVYLESIARGSRLGLTYGVAATLSNLAGNLMEANRLDEAYDYAIQALDLYRSIDAFEGQFIIMCVLAQLHARRGELDEAVRRYHEALVGVEERGMKIRAAELLQELGGVHLAMGDAEQAIEVLERALALEQVCEAPRLRCLIHESLGEAYEQAGRLAESLWHFRNQFQLRRELDNGDVHRMVINLELREKMREVEQRNDSLRRRSELLQQEIEQKSQQLSSMASRIDRHTEFLAEMKQKVASMANATEGPLAHELLAEIDDGLRNNDAWQMIEGQLDRMNHDVMHRLSERYPDLTPTELKVCALLKMNLRSKEIASLLGISLYTVETHRRHIRKKLRLEGKNLTAFLVGL